MEPSQGIYIKTGMLIFIDRVAADVLDEYCRIIKKVLEGPGIFYSEQFGCIYFFVCMNTY